MPFPSQPKLEEIMRDILLFEDDETTHKFLPELSVRVRRYKPAVVELKKLNGFPTVEECSLLKRAIQSTAPFGEMRMKPKFRLEAYWVNGDDTGDSGWYGMAIISQSTRPAPAWSTKIKVT